MIFYKQNFFPWSFWILLIASLCLIILDQQKLFPSQIKTYLQMSVTPLQYGVTLPERGINFLRDYFTLQHELLHDKKKWQSQQLLLQAKLQEMATLKQQNQELQSLLRTPSVTENHKYLLARITAINSTAHTREILINQGQKAGLKVGQGIVAADGIIGQIIQVNPLNSRAILLSDPRSAIPVTNHRTQENLIVLGNGNNQELTLLNPSNNDLKVGDQLFSSGLGGHYPPNYFVGTISALKMQGKNIQQVLITPAANLNRLHLVLIIFTNDENIT